MRDRRKAPAPCRVCPYTLYEDETLIFCGVCVRRISEDEAAARRKEMHWQK